MAEILVKQVYRFGFLQLVPESLGWVKYRIPLVKGSGVTCTGISKGIQQYQGLWLLFLILGSSATEVVRDSPI